MSVLNLFTNKDAVSLALQEAGVVRIPFTDFNNSISDLIEVYTKNILSFSEYYSMLQVLKAQESYTTAIENTSLYVFRKKNFKMFLQMISKENFSTDEGESRTLNSKVLFTTADCAPNLAVLPEFTCNDIYIYEHILSTSYATSFHRDAIYVAQVESEIECWNKFESRITEYLLYIP